MSLKFYLHFVNQSPEKTNEPVVMVLVKAIFNLILNSMLLSLTKIK